MRRYLLVALGGSLGAMLRYFIGLVMSERIGSRFPLGTLSINISACFLIGFIVEYLNHHTGTNEAWRYVFAIGFIGAYSTFSTFELEAWSDITHGAFWLGILYVVVSLIGGFIAVALGSLTARSLA